MSRLILLALFATTQAYALDFTYFNDRYGMPAGYAISTPGITNFYDRDFQPIATAISGDIQQAPKATPIIPPYGSDLSYDSYWGQKSDNFWSNEND